MNKLIGLFAIASLSSLAAAQSGTYIWQLSDDNGVTWSSNLLVPQHTVKVRLLATWTGIAGFSLAYAGGQFDATLTSDGGQVGTITNIARPNPFNFTPQTLVSREFNSGTLIKIDTAADIGLPGTGGGWVNPGQQNAQFAPNYNTDNPVVVFTYDLDWGGHTTNIGMVLNQTVGRAMAVYTSDAGANTRLNASAVEVIGARIDVPSPAPLAMLGVGSLFATCRRRR